MKVFVSGPTGPPEEYASLGRLDHEIVMGRSFSESMAHPYDEDELAALCRDADLLVYSITDPVTRRVLESSSRLRLVTAPFIGFDNVDVPAATDLGVLVANSPSIENARGMAEATIGLMLALVKRLPHNESKLRRGGWGMRPDRGEPLSGKTIGLLGFGRIAREVAARLGGWGVELIAHDPYVPAEEVETLGVVPVSLKRLWEESDLVTLHPALTDETRGIVGEEELRSMKGSSYLINVARGELVDELALSRALSEGVIAGAALDTFEREPLLADSPLRDVPSELLILTPHIIGHSEAGRLANLEVCLNNVTSALLGTVPENVVNRDAIPRWRGRFLERS